MASKNEALVSEVAELLLTKIKDTAQMYGDNPGNLKVLAEAWATVADSDPREKRERTGRVSSG